MSSRGESVSATTVAREVERAEAEVAHEVWEEAETLAGRFRETLISLRGMDLWPRRASLLAIAGIVVAALLVAIRELPGPVMSTGGGTIPVVEFVGAALLATLAWSYLLAGAIHAHWGLRITVLILYTVNGLAFALEGMVGVLVEISNLWFLATRVHHLLTPRQDLAVARVLITELPLALLGVTAVLVLVGVWVMVLGRRRTEEAPRLALGTLLGCGIATAALYAVQALGMAVPFGNLFPIAVVLGSQFGVFGLLVLPVVLFVTASDFAEWAEVVAGKAVVAARGLHRLVLPVAATVSAVVILADAVRVAGGVPQLLGQLAPSLVLAALVLLAGGLLLTRAAPLKVPLVALLVAGFAGYLLSIEALHGSFVLLVLIPYLVGALVTALLVGRARPGLAVPALLFIVVLLVAMLDDWKQHGRTLLTPEQLRTGGALLCLGGVAFALARYRLGPRGARLIRLFLVLLLGLQALDWLSDLFHASSDLELAPLQASVMLLGLLWDVITSGESITNVRGRRVPHHSRVLVYFGYELLAAATIVWYYATPGPGEDTDVWVEYGIQLIGAPLLIVFFGLGLRTWLRATPAPAEPAAPAGLSSLHDRHGPRQPVSGARGD